MTSKDWRSCIVPTHSSLLEVLRNLDDTTMQIALMVDSSMRLIGVLTDGDIRRAMISGAQLTEPAITFATRNPHVVPPAATRKHAIEVMTDLGVHSVPIVDDLERLVGLLRLEELLNVPMRTTPVLVMAGGRGERLKPITDSIPKPLVHVGGEPMIDLLLRRLALQGFHHVYVAVHYRHEMVEDHLGSGARFGLKIEYLREPEPLGTAGALSFLSRKLTEPILVVNADVLTSVDFGEVMDSHLAGGALATVSCLRHRTEIPFAVVEEMHGRMTSLVEKPVREELVSAGVYVLSPNVVDRLTSGVPIDMPQLISQVVSSGDHVGVHELVGFWFDLGTSSSIRAAEAELSRSRLEL